MSSVLNICNILLYNFLKETIKYILFYFIAIKFLCIESKFLISEKYYAVLTYLLL